MSFLHFTLFILLWGVGSDGRCSRIRTRREIRELSTISRIRFIRAINQLKRNGVYDRLTRPHHKEFPFFHKTPLFFPWHRLYIRRFEEALQRIDSTITLPYWDWSLDADSPLESPVFTWFGGEGRWKDDCVTTGPFAGWLVDTPNRHCLKRMFDQESFRSLYSTPETIDDIIVSANSYHEFRSMFERGPHGGIHHYLGGDMDETWSSNDPFFWIHHAFVDKVWWDWQRTHSTANGYSGRAYNGRLVSLRDNLPSLGLHVSQVLDTRDLCYSYPKEEDVSIRDSEIQEILDEIEEEL